MWVYHHDTDLLPSQEAGVGSGFVEFLVMLPTCLESVVPSIFSRLVTERKPVVFISRNYDVWPGSCAWKHGEEILL